MTGGRDKLFLSLNMELAIELLASATFWTAVGSLAAVAALIAAIVEARRSRSKRDLLEHDGSATPRKIIVRQISDHTSDEAQQAVQLINGDRRTIGRISRGSLPKVPYATLPPPAQPV